MARHLRVQLLALAAALATVVFVPPAAAHGGGGHNGGGGGTATSYSGDATVIQGTVGEFTLEVIHAEVPSTGGTDEECALEFPGDPSPPCIGVPEPSGLLSGTALRAAVVAQGNSSNAEATLGSFGIIVGDPLLLGIEGVSSTATATCTNGVASATASSSAARVFLAALGGTETEITLTGAQNETVPLPGGLGFVVANQVTGGASGNTADITVTALRVVVPAFGIDLAIAEAHADITCGTNGGGKPKCKWWWGHGGHKGHKSYGGYKAGKFSFGFAASDEDLTQGHVLFTQKDLGLKVSGTPAYVSAYAKPGSPTSTRLTIHGPAVSGKRFGALSVGWMELDVDLDAAGDRLRVVLLSAPRSVGGVVLHTFEHGVGYGGVRVHT